MNNKISNVFNLGGHPKIIEALRGVAEKLIQEIDNAGYINPDLECELAVDDGRVFKLTFERVDLDQPALQQTDAVWRSEQLVCDVCGGTDVIEVPHMGRNCNRCHPL